MLTAEPAAPADAPGQAESAGQPGAQATTPR